MFPVSMSQLERLLVSWARPFLLMRETSGLLSYTEPSTKLCTNGTVSVCLATNNFIHFWCLY